MTDPEQPDSGSPNLFAVLLKIALGLAVIVAGVFMLVLPGPGIAAILAGLYIIARQFPGGRRLVARVEAWVRRKWRNRR
jgi:hypothetical protein